MTETIIDAMARYAQEEREAATDKGLTLAEHYMDEALAAATDQAHRVGEKLFVSDGEAILRWSIENSPGIRTLSDKAISDIVQAAVVEYHDTLARRAVECGE